MRIDRRQFLRSAAAGALFAGSPRAGAGCLDRFAFAQGTAAKNPPACDQPLPPEITAS